MFIDADEKMIVKRIFILLGFIIVPICIMLLSEALGINDYPLYEQVIGVELQIIFNSTKAHKRTQIAA